MTASLPSFPEFYRAINDRDPFPWQARLANRLATDGTWPDEIGVPTGMGKTACLEIAVWWLASQADRAPAERTAPTRIWWVVNRRLLVDSTAEQACKLAKKLEDSRNSGDSEGNAKPDSDALAMVAERLRSLSAGRGEPPLKVISLRGGLASRRPTDPSCPTVILCTLPMYGSRLLFRGYGSSRRAVDAAMAGTDSLVLLDEAHLAPHLRSLTVALNECIPGAQPLHGRALYIHVPPGKRRGGKDKRGNLWPVYGKEPEHVLQRLKDAQPQPDETVNLSPRRVAEVLGLPGEDPGRAPEVLPGILWEWVKTTTPPEGEAPVEPYFSGMASPEYTVSVIWRVHVPESGRRLWPRAKDREAVDILIHELKDTLKDTADTCWLGSDGVTAEEVASKDSLRPGDRIVLPTNRGLLDDFGWNPSATDPVVDVSLTGQGLPLNPTAVKRLCGIDLASEIKQALGTEDDETNELDEAERDQAITAILEAIRAVETPKGWDPEEWSDFTDSLEPSIVESRREVARLRVRSPQREGGAPVDDFDENSLVDSVSASNRELATLAGHGQAVGGQSRMVAEQVGPSSAPM